MSCLVSFIIPAYNASGTIFRCLDSIYSLCLDKLFFEVIAVDDCSTDNTVELLEEYACSHPNFVLLRQHENHRQGAARNRGIAIAKAKYIVFLDSDDEIVKGVVTAVRLADEKSLDMVAMRFAKVDNDGRIEAKESLPYCQERVFTGIEMQSEFPFWNTGPCAYVYRKAFLNKINYPFAEDVLFEDSDFINVHLFYAKRMSYCDDCGYYVHYNSGSTTHTISYKHLADYALLGTRMLRFYESLEDKSSKYAKTILEGGSFNVMKAFRKLFRLKTWFDYRAFYDRLDSYFDRSLLRGYREPKYCWTRWTRFCLKHRKFAIAILGIFGPIARISFKS